MNGRTFKRLGEQVSGAIEGKADAPPAERLILIAKAYLAFAAENPRLWHAVFNVEMTADSDVPEWYLAEMRRLFQIITLPLSELDPKATQSDLDLRTRALFSSIHGVVLLGLERRISGVPVDRIEGMIEYLLKSFASGTA